MDLQVQPCKIVTQCEPCVNIQYCVFLVLLNGSAKCMNKNETLSVQSSPVKVVVDSLPKCDAYAKNVSLYKHDMHNKIQQVIREDKLKGYEKQNSPDYNRTNYTSVDVGVVLTDLIMDLENAHNNITAKVFLRWNDSRLAWNDDNEVEANNPNDTSDYFVLPDEVVYSVFEIWSPLLETWPMDPMVNMTNVDGTLQIFKVSEFGMVSTHFTMSVELSASNCPLDMWRWPFETYSCHFPFNLQTLFGHVEVNFWSDASQYPRTAVSLSKNVTNSKYQVLNSSAHYVVYVCQINCSHHAYNTDIVYSFMIRSSSTLGYKVLAFVPIICAILMNLMLISLAPSSELKLWVAIACFTWTLFFLILFKEILQPYGDYTPLLIGMYCVNFFCALIHLTTTGLLMIYIKTKVSFPPCKWLLCLLRNDKFVKHFRLGKHFPLNGSEEIKREQPSRLNHIFKTVPRSSMSQETSFSARPFRSMAYPESSIASSRLEAELDDRVEASSPNHFDDFFENPFRSLPHSPARAAEVSETAVNTNNDAAVIEPDEVREDPHAEGRVVLVTSNSESRVEPGPGNGTQEEYLSTWVLFVNMINKRLIPLLCIVYSFYFFIRCFV